MEFAKLWLRRYLPLYFSVAALFIGGAYLMDRSVTAMAQAVPPRLTIVIDPGHGGEDGGTASCSGVLESKINLEVSLKLNDFLHLLGYHTVMSRETDTSIYTEGTNITEKKVSDLKNRTAIVENTPNAVLISIHQNHFPESKYRGAQVFYADTEGSRDLAEIMQSNLIIAVNPGSNRACKRAESVYLMQKITCPGILVECGFLSNPEEDALLQTPSYQQKICIAIAAGLQEWLKA